MARLKDRLDRSQGGGNLVLPDGHRVFGLDQVKPADDLAGGQGADHVKLALRRIEVRTARGEDRLGFGDRTFGLDRPGLTCRNQAGKLGPARAVQRLLDRDLAGGHAAVAWRGAANLDLCPEPCHVSICGGAAQRGVVAALRANEHLRNGINVYRGRITRPEVARALGLDWTEASVALEADSARD